MIFYISKYVVAKVPDDKHEQNLDLLMLFIILLGVVVTIVKVDSATMQHGGHNMAAYWNLFAS